MSQKFKFGLWAAISFAASVAALAQHLPLVSAGLVLIGFVFVYWAGTSRSRK